MVEYALLVALFADVCIASIGLLCSASQSKFSTIGIIIGSER